MDKELQKVVEVFTKDIAHWQEVKHILEEQIRSSEDDIRAKRALIDLIDLKVKEKETKSSKLN